MKAMSNKSEFFKVMSFGEFDYDFSLNLSETDAKKYSFDIDKASSIKDLSTLLKQEDVCSKVQMNSKNKLLNLLLFINKTNQNKTFIEYLSLNCIFLSNDLLFMKERMKSGFDDDFLFLLESNILPPNKYKFNINVENKPPKTFEMEFFMSDSKAKVADSTTDAKKGVAAEMNKKAENDDVKEAKKEEAKKVEEKKSDVKVEPKKEEAKKDEPKKVEEKKSDVKVEPKKEEPKKEEAKKVEDKKPDEPKKPKTGNKDNQSLTSFNLPSTQRPTNFLIEDNAGPEGKDDKMPAIDPSQINKNQQSPIILSKKRQTTNTSLDMNNSSLNNSIATYPKINISDQIKYDFEACDYLLLDLNQYIGNKNISLSDLHDFLLTRIINNYFNTSIILLFPNLDNIQRDQYQTLIELITIADIMIYDKRDANKMCTLMGYKVEEKNFEVRFMFLKELKKAKYKPHRTAMFLEDFNKLTIIVQETETNLIVFHNEFNFNVGFKVEYYKTVTDNYETLKYVFLGGLLSRIIQNKQFDVAFEAGCKTFMKMLEALYTKTNYMDDPEFFLVEILKKNEEEVQVTRSVNSGINLKNRNKSSTNGPQSKEKNFVLDSVNIKNSRLQPYNPLKDSNLKNYFQSSQTSKKSLNKVTSGKRSLNIENPHSQLEFIQQEQNKFLNILEQNQILQKKLVILLSNKDQQNQQKSLPNTNSFSSLNVLSQSLPQQYSQYSSDAGGSSRGLPKLDNNNNNPFNKLGNAPDYMTMSMEKTKKKSLKPITKEAYDRLTGTSKKTNNFSMGGGGMNNNMMNPQMVMMFMMMQNQQKKDAAPEKKTEVLPEKKSEVSPDKKSEVSPDKNAVKNDKDKSPEKKDASSPEKKKDEKKDEKNVNNMFTPEFMNQYSEMMKMMGMNNNMMAPQMPQKEKKSNHYKGRSHFDKKHNKNSNYDDMSSMTNVYNPTNNSFNPNHSIDLNKSGSKSPMRHHSKSPEKKDAKEEVKFEAKGELFGVDDNKTEEQKKYETEYKKKIEEKKKKEEDERKKKIEDERKKKEEDDRKKKESEDYKKKDEDERKRREVEEKMSKDKDGKKFEDGKKKDDKKPEENKKDDKKPEEVKKDDKKVDAKKDDKKPEEVKKDDKKPLEEPKKPDDKTKK